MALSASGSPATAALAAWRLPTRPKRCNVRRVVSGALKALSGGLAQRRNCLTDVWLLARAHSERGYPTVASQLRGPNTALACAPGWHRRILKTKETQQLQVPPFGGCGNLTQPALHVRRRPTHLDRAQARSLAALDALLACDEPPAAFVRVRTAELQPLTWVARGWYPHPKWTQHPNPTVPHAET